MKLKNKIAAGILSAAVLLSCASCGEDLSWTYRLGDYEVTSGMFVGMGIDAYQSAYTKENIDTSLPLKDQTIGEENALDWAREQAKDYAKEYLYIEQRFDEMGLSFTDEELATMEENADYYWNNLYQSYYEEEGCGEESYRALYFNGYKKTAVFDATYGEGGELEVPASELTAYFDRDYRKIRYLILPLTDADGNALEGEELEAEKEKAEALKARLESGEDFNTIYAEHNDVDYDADADYSRLIDLTDETYVSAITDTVSEMEPGQYAVAYSEKYAYIINLMETTDDDFESVRSTLLSTLKGEEFETNLDEAIAQLDVEENDASIKKHDVKNLE